MIRSNIKSKSKIWWNNIWLMIEEHWEKYLQFAHWSWQRQNKNAYNILGPQTPRECLTYITLLFQFLPLENSSDVMRRQQHRASGKFWDWNSSLRVRITINLFWWQLKRICSIPLESIQSTGRKCEFHLIQNRLFGSLMIINYRMSSEHSITYHKTSGIFSPFCYLIG